MNASIEHSNALSTNQLDTDSKPGIISPCTSQVFVKIVGVITLMWIFLGGRNATYFTNRWGFRVRISLLPIASEIAKGIGLIFKVPRVYVHNEIQRIKLKLEWTKERVLSKGGIRVTAQKLRHFYREVNLIPRKLLGLKSACEVYYIALLT